MNSPGGRRGAELVSVVIPAYNAAATIDETLQSVRRQTHTCLEIIVVNDGSTDATVEIAHSHARADDRIRVIEFPNAGVAMARNLGVAEGRGELIAPIDADDIWSPTKIELQLEAMARAGPRAGFAYTGFRRIDSRSIVLQTAALQCVNGRGFLRSIFSNFVANGSALLLRRAAFEEAGGYEPGLRALGFEGAEDHLLQIAIARRWEIVCVPYCLVGYRQTPGAMSRDQVRITRSQLAVIDAVSVRYPEVPDWVLRSARADLEARLAVAYAARARFGPGLRAAARSLSNHPLCGSDTLWAVGKLRFRRAARQAVVFLRPMRSIRPGPSFYEIDPRADLRFRGPRPNGWLIERLQAAEAEFSMEASGKDPGPRHVGA